MIPPLRRVHVGLVLTFATEFAAVAGLFLSIRLAAELLGPTGFGEYQVARRVFAVLASTLTIGIGIGLARGAARAGARRAAGAATNAGGTGEAGAGSRARPPAAGAYLLAGLAVVAPVLAVFAGLSISSREAFARIFYGDPAFAHLTGPIVLTVAGLALHYLVYSYAHGRFRRWLANGLQLINIAAVPPLALLVAGADAASALALTGGAWIATSLIAAGVSIARDAAGAGVSIAQIGRCARELLTFGAPRLPAELTLPGLLAIPTFLVAHLGSVEEAGVFSFGLSLLQVVAGLFSPASILLLPAISRLIAEGRWDRVAATVRRVLLGSLALAAPIVLASEIALELLVRLMLGPSFAEAAEASRWLLLGTFPYVVYIILRSPLDAIAVWPHNSINLVLALIVASGLIAVGWGWIRPQQAELIALALLGGLSFLSWRRSLGSAVAARSTPVLSDRPVGGPSGPGP
jgi:O-antigen/teichoic acid export membrane protein